MTFQRSAILWIAIPFTVVVVAFLVREAVRRPATVDFAAMSARAAPLVAALERYTDEHNTPPSRLDELVPKYIGELPTTGSRERPTFDYFTFPAPDGPRLLWQLQAPCGEDDARTIWRNPLSGEWRGPDDPSGS